MKIDNYYNNYNRIYFKGYCGPTVQKLFKDLNNDLSHVVSDNNSVKPLVLYEKLCNFVSSTNSDVVFDYQMPSFSKNWSGFYFKNRKNGNTVIAASRLVAHTRYPIKEEGHLFLVPPEIYPENRSFYPKNNAIVALNKLITRSENKAIDNGFISAPFVSIGMPIYFIPGLLLRCLRAICPPYVIKRQIFPYNVGEFKSLINYVDGLTEKYNPIDIDKLLQ